MPEKRGHRRELVPTGQGQCVWVAAGVISYRLCTLNYQCERCSLHQALVDGPALVATGCGSVLDQAEMERRRAEFDELFAKLPAEARKCRYMLTGDVSYKLCINSFRCDSCSYAQQMEDSLSVDMEAPADELQIIEGLRLAGGVHYHRGHTWVRVEREGDVRVGLDDFGQQLLGPVIEVHTPNPSEVVYEGATACELCCRNGRVRIPTPVSGRVHAVNRRLHEHPELINKNPYTTGWLYTVKAPNLPCELQNLLYGDEARCWFETEIQRARAKIHGDHARRTFPPIDKGALWNQGRAGEMAKEFLLAKAKKAA